MRVDTPLLCHDLMLPLSRLLPFRYLLACYAVATAADAALFAAIRRLRRFLRFLSDFITPCRRFSSSLSFGATILTASTC